MTVETLLPPTRVPATAYRRPRALVPGTLRLDGNEGSRPPRELLKALADLPAESLRRYPDLSRLAETIGRHHSLAPDRVVVTAGADDAMERVFRAFVDPGSRVVAPVPTFEMIHRFAATAGGVVAAAPWRDRFPLTEICSLLAEGPALVTVVSPNNPTGAVVSASELNAIALAAAAAGSIVLFDHVYAEYADEDLTAAALAHENVVVLRTLSKAWGLAGCRVGYALASPRVAAVLRGAGNPYPVSTLSATVAEWRLRSGTEETRVHVERVRSERARLAAWLAERDIGCRHSQGNFVFADFGRRAPFVDRALAGLGVLVRAFPHRAEIAEGLRISLPGDKEAFERLLDGLATVLEPEVLIFDLDGVLADVRESYRRSILDTAATFGVDLASSEIARAKLAGNANNDWLVTQRLLAEHGVEIDLEEVTRRFQASYLGTGDRPGRRQAERSLVPRARLAALSRRLPLAVVTGRPRQEAEWFLERAGLRDLFALLVCQEDAPAKPDPAPVRLALAALGFARAWLVGDTPDDLVAARAAGVVPIAVPAPGEANEETHKRLREAGAARVLDQTADLEELL